MIPLAKKYEPKTTSDLVGNPEIVKTIDDFIKSKNIPHLLLYGDAGTGKTSTAHVIIRMLYKGMPHTYKELNASDDNGIDIMRKEVKPFASYSDVQEDPTRDVNVDFKIIILDEVDEATPKAQASLRRTMEDYSKHCRFILICNYEYKIMKPIRDRCTQFQFNHVTPEQMLPRLEYICQKEGIQISQECLFWIAEKSDGSMRGAINNYLEICLTESNRTHQPIDLLWLQKKAIQSDDKLLDIFRLALNGKFMQCRQAIINIMNEGKQIRVVLNHIINVLYIQSKFSDAMKGDFALLHLHAEEQIVNGVDKYVVISNFIANLMKIGVKYKPKTEVKK